MSPTDLPGNQNLPYTTDANLVGQARHGFTTHITTSQQESTPNMMWGHTDPEPS